MRENKAAAAAAPQAFDGGAPTRAADDADVATRYPIGVPGNGPDEWDDGWDDDWEDDDPWDEEDEWEEGCDEAPDRFGEHPAPPAVPIRTDDELLGWVCALVGPDREGPFSVQVMFLDGDGMALPVRVPLDEVPSRPVGKEVDAVLGSMGHVLGSVAPDGALVIALVRRGGGDRGDLEIAWTRALLESARRVPVRLRAVLAVGRHRARILSPALTA